MTYLNAAALSVSWSNYCFNEHLWLITILSDITCLVVISKQFDKFDKCYILLNHSNLHNTDVIHRKISNIGLKALIINVISI